MKCDKCKINEANILIRQVLDGKESEIKICEECAKKMGMSVSTFNLFSGDFIQGNIFDALTKLNGFGPVNTGVFVPSKTDSTVCEFCKTTLQEFRESGKLGCANCYDAFEGQLVQIFRRVQSGDIHRGRKIAEGPESTEIRKLNGEIAGLQEQIKKAVEIEDYEKAALIKSEILKLQDKLNHIKTSFDSKNKKRMKPSEGSEVG